MLVFTNQLASVCFSLIPFAFLLDQFHFRWKLRATVVCSQATSERRRIWCSLFSHHFVQQKRKIKKRKRNKMKRKNISSLLKKIEGNFLTKKREFPVFFYKCKLCIAWNWFLQKLFQSHKIFVWRLFKMVVNRIDCSKREQRSSIKSLVSDKYKPYEINRKMCDMLGEIC